MKHMVEFYTVRDTISDLIDDRIPAHIKYVPPNTIAFKIFNINADAFSKYSFPMTNFMSDVYKTNKSVYIWIGQFYSTQYINENRKSLLKLYSDRTSFIYNKVHNKGMVRCLNSEWYHVDKDDIVVLCGGQLKALTEEI